MAQQFKLKIMVDEHANKWTAYGTTDARIRVYRSTTGLEAGRVLHTTITMNDPTTDPPGSPLHEYIDPDGQDTYVAWYTFYDIGTGLESAYGPPIKYGTADTWYINVTDLRDENITTDMADDDRLVLLIRQAQSFIDRATGRHFLPVEKTIKIDSEWGTVLPVPEPIIRIDDTVLEELSGSGSAPTEIDYDHTLMRVYNRHLTQGMLNPDDREYPKLEIPPEFWAVRVRYGEFKRSRQQMKLTGVFGYTELRPSDPIGETSAGSQVPLAYGRTPPAIQDAMKRLIMRWISPVGDADYRRMDEMVGRVKSWKTSEQSITYFGGGDLGVPHITGDASIDSVLSMYSAHNKLSMSAA